EEGEGGAEEGAGAEAAEPEPAPKKKTRRGTRGGRNRKKKPAAAPVEAANGDQPAAEEVEAPAAPVIHVPGRELEEEPPENGEGAAQARHGPAPRGSRRGRNRQENTRTAAPPTAR